MNTIDRYCSKGVEIISAEKGPTVDCKLTDYWLQACALKWKNEFVSAVP